MTRLFVIVDQSLSKRQQFVQGAHAVAQHLIDFPDSEWKNRTLVMLKSRDLGSLKLKLLASGNAVSHFIEPYFGDMLTAISAINIGDKVEELKLI